MASEICRRSHPRGDKLDIRLTSGGHPALGNQQRAGPDREPLGTLGRSAQGPQPSQQFVNVERFDQTVLGPDVQPLDPIPNPFPGRSEPGPAC